MRRERLIEVMRILLGAIYCFSGFSKTIDLHSFENVIAHFEVAPSGLIIPTATIIVSTEMILGVALLLGFRVRFASMLLGYMTLLFLLVVTVVFINGKSVECGCFGKSDSEVVGIGVIGRDIVLIICCAWLAWQEHGDEIATE